MSQLRVRGLLFDLDGTLIDSLPAVNRAWTAWSEKVGLNPDEVLARIHGRRSIDSVRDLLPDSDVEAEDAWLRKRESEDTEGVRLLPGVAELISTLPKDSWLVVTSGTSEVASARMRKVGIDPPPLSVYGEDVKVGKPRPDPYLLAAARLGLPSHQCAAFEDATSGLTSATAANCQVVSVDENWPTAKLQCPLSEINVRQDGVDLVITRVSP